MEFSDYNPNTDFTDYTEQNYNRNLKQFLRENIGLVELDFINIEILNTENVLKNIPILSDDVIFKIIESKYTAEQKTDLDYENHIKYIFEGNKRKQNQKRQVYIHKIEDLNIKKNRLPQPTEIIDDELNKSIPYKIALLNEIGFFDLDVIKKLTKENQFKVINQLTGSPIRTIKGNVNVLINSNTKEDITKYTSKNYVEEVKNYLNRLT